MIKAFLFDLDGVILDSNPEIITFWGGWATKLGIPFNETVIKENIYGRTTWETIHTLFHASDKTLQQEIYDDGKAYDMRILPALVPGVADFIAAIADRNIPLALVTSSPQQRAFHFLRKHQLDHYFKYSITAENVSNGKPHPEPYEKGGRLIGIDPIHCMVFEDSNSGIKAALDAGMQVIAVNNPEYKHERLAYSIENFNSMSAELDVLTKGN